MILISGRALFDTNAASALIRQTSELLSKLAPSCLVLLLLIVVGELFYGAFHAQIKEAQLANVRAFIRRTIVVRPDEETAEKYGRIKAEPRVRGAMIPENDIWIAAITLLSELPLVTQDQHFANVDGIRVVSW